MTGRGTVAFCATIFSGLAFLPPAATAQETKPAQPTAASPQPAATAQGPIGEYLKGKRIVWTIACRKAGRATVTWELNQNGNLTILTPSDPTQKQIEIVDGKALSKYSSYSAALEGGVLTVIDVARWDKNVRLTDALKITGHTCSMKHKVEPGATAYDTTCKAVTCTVHTVPSR